MTHDVNVKLTRKTPDSLTYDEIKYTAKPKQRSKTTGNGTVKSANETFPREFSYTLNDYMLARGFAAVYAAGIGTMDSDGFRTCGSKEETESTTAIIEWLAGNRKAFIDKTSGIEIKAWWCNKHVAMTGKSYLGTLATAAATTGVEGLSTIISEAAISNWYDYYRDGGLVVAPGGFPGEDADVLAEDCFSRRKQSGDFLHVKKDWENHLAKITRGQDRDNRQLQHVLGCKKLLERRSKHQVRRRDGPRSERLERQTKKRLQSLQRIAKAPGCFKTCFASRAAHLRQQLSVA